MCCHHLLSQPSPSSGSESAPVGSPKYSADSLQALQHLQNELVAYPLLVPIDALDLGLGLDRDHDPGPGMVAVVDLDLWVYGYPCGYS